MLLLVFIQVSKYCNKIVNLLNTKFAWASWFSSQPLTSQYLPYVRKIARIRNHTFWCKQWQTTYGQIMHILIYAAIVTAVKQLKFKWSCRKPSFFHIHIDVWTQTNIYQKWQTISSSYVVPFVFNMHGVRMIFFCSRTHGKLILVSIGYNDLPSRWQQHYYNPKCSMHFSHRYLPFRYTWHLQFYIANLILLVVFFWFFMQATNPWIRAWFGMLKKCSILF